MSFNNSIVPILGSCNKTQMRIIARRTLIQFVDTKLRHAEHKALKSAIETWFAEARHSQWKNMAEVKSHYRNASVVSADRVVFNIKGNDYRLVVAIDFEKSILFIKWLGTHRDYDKINVKEISYRG